MSLSDEQKFEILSDYASGISPTEVSQRRDISYATALRYKKDFEEAKKNNTLDKLIDLSAVARDKLAKQVIDQSPDGAQELVKQEMGKLLASLDMADVLKTNLQAAANKLTERIVALANSAQSPSELIGLTEALCNMQNAFFNKNTTQVNVQNNFGADQAAGKYDGLLGDKPSA